jgi:hypothetical protein
VLAIVEVTRVAVVDPAKLMPEPPPSSIVFVRLRLPPLAETSV